MNQNSIAGCICTGGLPWDQALDTLLPVGNELSFVNAITAVIDDGNSGTITVNGVMENALYYAISRVAAQIDYTFSNAQICGGGCPQLLDDLTETLIYSATRTLWPSSSSAIDLGATALQATALNADMPTEAEIATFADTLRGELCAMNFGSLATGFQPYILNGFDTSSATSIVSFAHDILKKIVVFECDAGGQLGASSFSLFSRMLVRALTTNWEGTTPVSSGMLSAQELNTLVGDFSGCACHYFRTDTDVLPFIKSRIDQYSQTSPPDWGDAIVTTARQAIRTSTGCGSDSCRSAFTNLHGLISKMSNYQMTPLNQCSAASGSTCFGAKSTFAGNPFTGQCAAVPVKSSANALAYPFQHINDDVFVQFIYWSTCWMSTDCPPPGVALFEVQQELTIDETVESFNEAKQATFKSNYKTMIDPGGHNGITLNDISLDINAGSLVVTVSVRTASASTQQAIVTIVSQTPAQLTQQLGLPVTQAQAPTVQQVIIAPPPPPPSPESESKKKKDGMSVGVIVAIAVGAVVVVILIAVALVCYFKGKADAAGNQPKFTPSQPHTEMQAGGKV